MQNVHQRSAHQIRVDEFMLLAKQTRPTSPTIPNDETALLRASLILEEAFETIAALGVRVTIDSTRITESMRNLQERLPLSFDDLMLNKQRAVDLVEVVDGCCDLSVVTIGTLSALGVNDEPVLAEVDENNLAKFGTGGYRRPDGKWIKPSTHKPPDLRSILQAMKL